MPRAGAHRLAPSLCRRRGTGASHLLRSLHTERRYRQVFRAVSSGLVSKGVNLLVNLLLVPMLLRYLGAERYGLWVTITSTVSMFVLLDIGVANTLTNLVAEAYAAGDERLAAEYFSSAFWTVCGVSSVIGLAAWLLWPHVDWAAVFHVSGPALAPAASRAMAVSVALLLCSLPAGLAARLLAGYQELHLANIFAAVGSVGSLLGVVTGLRLGFGLPALVAGYAAPIVGANVLSLLWIVFFHKPWISPLPRLLRRAHVERILRSGGQFFIIQVAGLVVMNSDNLVLSHFLSPAAVTPYNTTWRLTGYVLALQGLPIGAMWPALAEAHARHDLLWIRTAYRRMRSVTLAILFAACCVLLLFGKSLIRLWAGAAAVPGTPLLVLMCAWMCLCAVTVYQANLMGAVSRVGRQALSSGIAAAVNLLLSLWWVRSLGQTGVILATVVSYSIFVVAVQVHEVRGILRGEQVQPQEAVLHV